MVKRANPVLRDADRLFGILSAQRDQLAQLAADSERILGPLSRERRSVAGFFANAGAAAQASAEKGAALEASLRKLPAFLRELRGTMASLEYFSKAGTPVSESLAKAAPALTQATRALTPFSAASTVSLKSLGANGETAGPKIHAADPVVEKARDLGQSGATPVSELADFLASTRKSGGFDSLADLIYNSAARDQRIRQVRPLRPQPHGADQLHRLRGRADHRLLGQLQRPGVQLSRPPRPPRRAPLPALCRKRLGGKTRRHLERRRPGRAAAGRAGPGEARAQPEAPGLGEGEQLGAKAEGDDPSQRALLDYLLGP